MPVPALRFCRKPQTLKKEVYCEREREGEGVMENPALQESSYSKADSKRLLSLRGRFHGPWPLSGPQGCSRSA